MKVKIPHTSENWKNTEKIVEILNTFWLSRVQNNIPIKNKGKSESKSRSSERSNSKSLHDYLYKCRKVYQERRQKFSKYLNRRPVNYPGVHKRSNSSKIMQKIKIQRCKDLFKKLDDDQDGYISSQKIDILKVSNEIIDIITPLLLKIEEKGLILNYPQFYEMLTIFSRNLNVEEKSILFGQRKTMAKTQDFSKPLTTRVNSKSLHL